MKIRPVLLLLAFLIITGMSSCVRDYICQCQISYSGKPGLPDTTVNEYPIKDTKGNAKSLCEQNSFTTEANGVKTVEDCHLY